MKLMAFLLALALAGATPAMVVASKGPVPAQVLTTLQAGQKLTLAAGSELTVSFLQGGGRTHCKGPGVFQVGQIGMTLLSGSGSVQSEKSEARAALTPSPWINWDEMAGVRRDELRYAGDPTWLEPRAQLHWEAPADVQELEVVVEHLPDYGRIYKGTVAARAPLPLELEPGQSYVLSLRGFSPGRVVEAAEQRLEVLSEQDRVHLLAWESAARTPADVVELYSWLVSRGLLSRAERLRLEHPGVLP
ncbi:MAG: hypothetical protein KF760_05790 [Candidatus Eremiobacteraeota bacterium]|nr:hypothetical protein [Candidatus Eremiobacteraeota bacterium]MCW5867093.1 hypothetical protein [Candidatus Eremiobacteraeota bacterium]